MSRLRLMDLITGVAGGALAVALFLNWYSVPDPAILELQRNAGIAGFEVSLSGVDRAMMQGWDLTVMRFPIYLAGVLGLALPITYIVTRVPGYGVVLTCYLIPFAALAVGLITYRLIDMPVDGARILGGAYLALGSAGVLLAAAFLSLKDETAPAGFERAPEPEHVALPVVDSAG